MEKSIEDYIKEQLRYNADTGLFWWEYDLTIPLVEMGYAENPSKARLMIHDAINSL